MGVEEALEVAPKGFANSAHGKNIEPWTDAIIRVMSPQTKEFVMFEYGSA